MTRDEIAALINSSLVTMLVGWRLKGCELACIVDGEPTAFEAGTPRVEAEARAKALGIEMLELANADHQVKIGEALLAAMGRHIESEFAAAMAAGAGKV
jgi:hypothetical protein